MCFSIWISQTYVWPNFIDVSHSLTVPTWHIVFEHASSVCDPILTFWKQSKQPTSSTVHQQCWWSRRQFPGRQILTYYLLFSSYLRRLTKIQQPVWFMDISRVNCLTGVKVIFINRQTKLIAWERKSEFALILVMTHSFLADLLAHRTISVGIKCYCAISWLLFKKMCLYTCTKEKIAFRF